MHCCMMPFYCAAGSQTRLTLVGVVAIMEQTVITPVSVTQPVSDSETVVQTMLNYVEVSNKTHTHCKLLILPICHHKSFLLFPEGSTSCKGRCGESYNSENKCHCNSKCAQYNNCCSDYKDLCDSKAIHVSP